jgi:hypothetical protein
MRYISISHGMRGFFAVEMDEEGPIRSGIGSYETAAGAVPEAMGWAHAEGIRYLGPKPEESQKDLFTKS